MSKILLYHYTSESGAIGIQKNRVIHASATGAFGSGVYFTSVGPYNKPEDILINNYDDAGNVINDSQLWDKIEWVVEVNLPRNEIKKVKGCNRDVYLKQGDVVLDKYQWKIYQR